MKGLGVPVLDLLMKFICGDFRGGSRESERSSFTFDLAPEGFLQREQLVSRQRGEVASGQLCLHFVELFAQRTDPSFAG